MPNTINADLMAVDSKVFFATPRRLLFLDFDGVLNSNKWFKSWAHRQGVSTHAACVPPIPWPTRHRREHVDPRSVAVLNRIVEEFDMHIVVSSTWRRNYSIAELREALVWAGLADPSRVIGKTSVVEEHEWTHKVPRSETLRGLEIEQWIMAAVPMHTRQLGVPIVILDDDSDFGRLRPFHLKTSSWTGGLNANHIARVRSLLRRQQQDKSALRCTLLATQTTMNPRWLPDVAVTMAADWGMLRHDGPYDTRVVQLISMLTPHYQRYRPGPGARTKAATFVYAMALQGARAMLAARTL